MKTKRWLGLILLMALISVTRVSAQQSAYQPTYPPPSPLRPQAAPDIPQEAYIVRPSGLSDWITYRRECCEGKFGPITPLSTELYFFSGPSFPIGRNTLLSRELVPGWSIGGGAKALFYNESYTRAWVIDAHIINTNEGSANTGVQYPLVIEKAGQARQNILGTVQSSTRTSAGLGLGRAWYPWEPANSEGHRWRLGVDVGGRYGSHILNLNEARSLKDVCGGLYAAGYTNFECPWRRFTLLLGARGEWAYTFTDILQRNSDIQEINVLFSAGVRW